METFTHGVERGKNRKHKTRKVYLSLLVGTLDRFNNAKRAEEKDRVKHEASAHFCEDIRHTA